MLLNEEDQNGQFQFGRVGTPQYNFEELDYDFDIWLAVLREKMPKQPNKSQDKAIRDLIITYFKVKLGIKIDSQYFCPKPEPEYTSDEFILYGVDFLSTQILKAMLYPIKFKKRWINDSSCQLFLSLNDAEGMFEHLKNAQDYDLANEDGQFPFREWYELNPYYIFGCERRLFMRYATNNDILINPKENINSYGLYEEFRSTMPMQFLQKFNAMQVYKQLLKNKVERKRNQIVSNSQYLENTWRSSVKDIQQYFYGQSLLKQIGEYNEEQCKTIEDGEEEKSDISIVESGKLMKQRIEEEFEQSYILDQANLQLEWADASMIV